MSRANAFFNPRSLVRIARAVEWEPDLSTYRDGSTNQGRYMEALAILLRGWLSGEAIPEALEAADALFAEDFVPAAVEVIGQIPGKIAQLVGWWRGVFGRQLRRRASTGPGHLPPVGRSAELLGAAVDDLVRELGRILGEG